MALTVIAGSLARRLGVRDDARRATATRRPQAQSVRLGPVADHATPPLQTPAGGALPSAGRALVAANGAGAAPDTLFDHTEDVEFILDPVKLQRGRATVTRPPAAQGEKAAISF
jgi:hypothetical protein